MLLQPHPLSHSNHLERSAHSLLALKLQAELKRGWRRRLVFLDDHAREIDPRGRGIAGCSNDTDAGAHGALPMRGGGSESGP